MKNNILLALILIVVVLGGGFAIYKIINSVRTEKNTTQDDSVNLKADISANQSGENKQAEQNQDAPEGNSGDIKPLRTETTPEGLKIEIFREGDEGREVANGDTVAVHYVGFLENGVKFDSSLDRNEPFAFVVGAGQVIRGWEIGLLGMRVNEARRLIIPSELGYGENGAGEVIPPNAVLIFEIQLLGIKE